MAPVPRRRGDQPPTDFLEEIENARSPQARGSTEIIYSRRQDIIPFPAGAGINR